MSLKHGLLGLLNYKSMTGYELDREFKESLAHFWQATASQIYYDLDKMEQKGWLVSERVIQENKPNRRVYTITTKGRTEFFHWLSTPGDDIKNATRVKSTFFMHLFFAGETSQEQAFELLHSYREQCLVGLQEMDAVYTDIQAEPHYDPAVEQYWKLIVMHGEMMRKTRLEWVEKAIAILEGREEWPF